MPAPAVVVIGSGFGGLAAAIRLQARGFAVTLLEKREAPGGRAYVYRDAGFTFDGGPTVVTAPFLFEELFDLAGRRMADYVRLVPVDPYYRIRFHDGRSFHYSGDPARMAAEVAAFNPADVDGYARFIEASRRIYEVGFDKLADRPFSSWTDMARVLPEMIRLGSHRTVYGLARKHLRDPDLRTVMSFHPLLVGGNPFATTSIYSLIAFLERRWGVWFPMGGTGALVSALARLFTELGGTLRCGVEVERIEAEAGRAVGVRTAAGERLPARYVVSNADAPYTYRHLIDPEHRRKHTDRRIEALRYSMGLVVIYFGTDRPYPELAHHTILLGPRYEALLDDIFAKKVLAPDHSLYLHAPTRTDPSLAPPGHEAFYVLAPVPHLGSGTDWRAEGPRFMARVFDTLERTVVPGLRRHLVTYRMLTPLDFKETLNSLYGAGFSVEPTLAQSAYFRPHNRSEELENLFLVGAGTHPGAGMPGVLSSAKVVDRLIPDAAGTGNPRDPIAGTHAR